MKKILTSIVILTIVLMPICVSAETMENTKIHHESISVDVPNNLSLFEYDDDYEIMYYSQNGVNDIFSLDDDNIDFHIYFSYILSDTLMYDEIHGEKEAYEMSLADQDIISDVLYDQYGVGLYDDDWEFLKSSTGSDDWIRYRCEYENENDSYVYVNETNSKAIRMFLVRNNNGNTITEKQLKLADSVVKSFKDDSDYINEVYEYYDPEHSELSGETWCILVLIFAVYIFLKLFIFNRKVDIKLADKSNTESTIEEYSAPEEIESYEETDTYNESDTYDVEYEVEEVPIQTSYEEGLKELYKSGLLTKAQLNEMLEKHNAKKGGIR